MNKTIIISILYFVLISCNVSKNKERTKQIELIKTYQSNNAVSNELSDKELLIKQKSEFKKQNSLISYDGVTGDTLSILQTHADGTITHTKISGKGQAKLYSTTENIMQEHHQNQTEKNNLEFQSKNTNETIGVNTVISEKKEKKKAFPFFMAIWLLIVLVVVYWLYKKYKNLFT